MAHHSTSNLSKIEKTTRFPSFSLMASSYVVLLLFMFIQVNASQPDRTCKIHLDSELSPTKEPKLWYSSSNQFAFGFYEQGDGFSVGIRLLTEPYIIVWTAYRDDPPVSSNAKLLLTKDGIVLRTDQTKDKVFDNSINSASYACMLDNGNFVVYNESFGIIWSSFNYRTDTILGGQNLYAMSELFSNVSKTSSSTGQFRLKMQEDGNLVLYPKDTIDEYTEASWASGTNSIGGQFHLYLTYTGELLILNNDMSIIKSLSYKNLSFNQGSIIYRATLGLDGVFRLYSHQFGSVRQTNVLWAVPDQICRKTFCSFNSYCKVLENQPICSCLPGTDFVDSNNIFSGCEKKFIEQSCKGMNKSAGLYNMTAMVNIRCDDYPYWKASMSEEDCRKSCLEDCNCDAVLYETGLCSKLKHPLKAFRQDLESSFTSYFKIGLKNVSLNGDAVDLFESKEAMILIMLITSGFITCSCVFLAISGFFISKYRVAKYKWLLETRNFGLNDEHTLRSFYYKELKKATKGFKEKLGKGSFGAVYKGALYKGEKLVAVKRLEKLLTDGEREFRSEMHVIGRTHHKNLVRLLGYCAEDSKRLLVYEYMSNGSLADLLFNSERFPDWNERVRIALDVARGILYLHDECEAPIIHCDIKPQNILMDDFWTAKISDFGLAKLLMPDQTRTFTLIRGTRGYMAPEWSKNIPISIKVDVYSYGVVLLEIVCCRRNLDVHASKPEEIVLIKWVYKCFINRELNKLVCDEEVDKKILENMVKVGLWCVQDEPALRPSMKSVVMMLEGITDVSVPPCPTSS